MVQTVDADGIPYPDENSEGLSFELGLPNYWVKDLQLSQRESHVLISDLMLNACHIGAAMYLLRKIDPKLGGCDYQTRLSVDVSKNTLQPALPIIHESPLRESVC